MMNKSTLAVVALVTALLCPDLGWSHEQWWRTKLSGRYYTFDWNCARKDRMTDQLRTIANEAVTADDAGRPGTWADRAIAIRLRTDRDAVLFVPITCGATGNCHWRMYDSRGLRFVGEFWAQYIYVRTTRGSWPMIITYSHMTACEGFLSRIEYRQGRYRDIQDDYAIDECGVSDVPMPTSVRSAQQLCAKYGY
jgi:hypothetical protein